MGLLSITRGQPCQSSNLQCASKRLPVNEDCASTSPTVNFGFGTGTQVLARSKMNLLTFGRASTSLVKPISIIGNYFEPSTLGIRTTIGYGGSPQIRGLFLDIKGKRTLGVELAKIGCSEKRMENPAAAGEESSVKENDTILAEEGTVNDGTTANSSSSNKPTWLFGLKQVDWNKLIFNWQKDEPMWTVPWTGQTIFQVMVLWFAAFWVMGSWIIPVAAQVVGFSRHSLTFRGQALYSLITDIAEGTVGIWILKRCLARFFPLPAGWFPVKWQGENWLAEASWGCLLFPLVNKLSQLNLHLLPVPSLTSSYVEQSMMSRDPVATLLYAIVISICAPVWEEVIFRGFLLPSMTRYMPLWGAISVSALAFALAHFSMQRILPLTFLGLVMGFVFVRSKNLLSSILLHSLWNGFAFLELL